MARSRGRDSRSFADGPKAEQNIHSLIITLRRKKKTISEIRQGDDTTTKMKKKRSLMGGKKKEKRAYLAGYNYVRDLQQPRHQEKIKRI
jgi:hypothetical protein